MSLSPLRKLDKLVPADLNVFFSDVTLVREIPEICWFSHICLSITELLVICNYTQTALKFILDIFLYFKKDVNSFHFLFKQVSQTCIEKNSKGLKKLLYGEELFRMIETLDNGFSKKNVKSLKNLDKFFRFAGIRAVEIRINCSELFWGWKEGNFSVFFANVNGKTLFLHKNKRLSLNIQEIKHDPFPDDELKPMKHEEALESFTENETLETEEPNDESFFIEKSLKTPKANANQFLCPSSFPATPCGSILCQNCSKRLKRSTHFIINPKCCNYHIFNTSPPTPSFPSIPEDPQTTPPDPPLCLFCSKPGSKKEQMLCICCILNKFIYKCNLKPFSSCNIKDPTNWIDIDCGPIQVSSKCGFCDTPRNSLFMSSVCFKCQDQVCLPCLRKNPFISEGLCSSCNVKRQMNFNEI
jgi:hypothetical protein